MRRSRSSTRTPAPGFSTTRCGGLRAYVGKYLKEARSTVRPQSGTVCPAGPVARQRHRRGGRRLHLERIEDDGPGPEDVYLSSEGDRQVRDALGRSASASASSAGTSSTTAWSRTRPRPWKRSGSAGASPVSACDRWSSRPSSSSTGTWIRPEATRPATPPSRRFERNTVSGPPRPQRGGSSRFMGRRAPCTDPPFERPAEGVTARTSGERDTSPRRMAAAEHQARASARQIHGRGRGGRPPDRERARPSETRCWPRRSVGLEEGMGARRRRPGGRGPGA